MVELQTLADEVTRYAYNHDGIRLSQTRDATGTAKTTHYLIDPNTAYAQVIEESEQTGTAAPTLTALYALGDDRIRQYRPAQKWITAWHTGRAAVPPRRWAWEYRAVDG